MKHLQRILSFLLLSNLIIISGSLIAQTNKSYVFVNPKPSSRMVSHKTNIILRNSISIDQESLSGKQLQVIGSRSGLHAGEFLLADDGKTLVFNPFEAFAFNELVNVVVPGGIKTISGSSVPSYSFSFSTLTELKNKLPDFSDGENHFLGLQEYPLNAERASIDYSLPAPTITIDSVNDPSPGYIFMATWDRNVPAVYGNFIFILDKNGAIVDSVRVNGAPYDFQIQQNGLLTYALGDFSSNVPLPGEELQHMVLDENLTIVDSFKMKNGYITDFHEFKMLPNGHVMMMSYHTIPYDMSTIVDGGKENASLVINIIQEQDRNKNVVFEWRNIDYIPITDSDEDLTADRINYSTLNAFDIDNDGNILASFRNHSEIMKISRETGEILWRMGGPRGEFTFIGEHEENAPYYFARQHNIRRRPNGNITLFDNGQFHTPPYSRAVEYSVDEENKVATLVSEWRYPNGNIFCVTAGNAEWLPDSGWFIGYGVPNPQFVKRNAVEVHPDGSIALELSLPSGVLAYRATKFPWKENVSHPSFTHFEVKEGVKYSFNNSSIETGIDITYDALAAADYNESKITRVSYGPVQPEFIDNIITVYPVSVLYEGLAIDSQTAEFRFDLSVYPEIFDPENTSIYYRAYPGQGLFLAQGTSLDTVNNELVALLNGFGEVVFGVPDNEVVNNAPILYEPLNQTEFLMEDSVTLKWTGKGMYDAFNIQVSTENSFTTLARESNSNISELIVTGLEQNSLYFWRVNSVLGDQTSTWSEVWNFYLEDTTVSVIEPIKSFNRATSLEQNFPNPFSTSTKISYALQESTFVSLEIYNSLGKVVKTMVNEYQLEGKYIVTLEASSFPPGIYFYKLQSGNDFIDVKRMSLTR